MTTITFQDKCESLKKYSRHLKSQLKLHSGESVRKGSSIENKLRIYKKIRKLFNYLNDLENPDRDEKAIKRLDEYYSYLEHKCKKLENNQNNQNNQKTVIGDEKSSSKVSKLKDQHEAFVPDSIPLPIESDTEYDELSEIKEMGPTPQLNGRVLTIFDIQTSPEKIEMSPMKLKVGNLDSKINLDLGITLNPIDNDEKIFKTPSKVTSTYSYSSLDSISRKLDFNMTPSKSTPKTLLPTSKTSSNIYETPRYLRTQASILNNVDEIIIGDQWSEDDGDDGYDHDEKEQPLSSIMLSDDVFQNDEMENIPCLKTKNNIEPSPILKRSGRSLFELHKDLVGLKRNLTDLQELMSDDELHVENNETINNETDLVEGSVDNGNLEAGNGTEKKDGQINDDDNDDNDNDNDDDVTKVFDPHYNLRNKVKTVKRSTRRAKLRTENLDLKDGLYDLDIHALAYGKHKLEFDEDQNQTSEDVTSNRKNDSDNEFEEDELYERKDIEQLQKELNVGKSRGKAKHPLSNNFVRLKINRGGKGRFKRRR